MLVRQLPPDRTGFEQVVFVTAGLAQVVTLVVVVLLAVIFYRMWKAQQAMQEQLGRLSAKVDPMIASATTAAENVRALTDVVKRDATAAAEALSVATTRVRDSVTGIADRIDDFGELLARVTDKAEAVTEVAAAAVSTFQAGRRLFRTPDEPPSRREAAPRPPAPRPDETRRQEPRHLDRERQREHEASPDEEFDEPLRLAGDDALESPYAEEPAAPPSKPKRRRRRRRGGGGAGGRGAGGDAPAP